VGASATVDCSLKFLASGSSDYSIELLKSAGVDMMSPEALGMFEDSAPLPRLGQNLAKGQEALILDLDLETQAVVSTRNNGLCAPSEELFTASR
jgi:hypothetical protein